MAVMIKLRLTYHQASDTSRSTKSTERESVVGVCADAVERIERAFRANVGNVAGEAMNKRSRHLADFAHYEMAPSPHRVVLAELDSIVRHVAGVGG